MDSKKEARQMWKSGRASANEGNRIIPHDEWERGMRLLPVPFLAMLAAYAVMLACGAGS